MVDDTPGEPAPPVETEDDRNGAQEAYNWLDERFGDYQWIRYAVPLATTYAAVNASQAINLSTAGLDTSVDVLLVGLGGLVGGAVLGSYIASEVRLNSADYRSRD